MKRTAHFSLVAVIVALGLLPEVSSSQAHQATATEAIHLQVYGLASYVRPRFGPQDTAGGIAAGGSIGVPQHFVPCLEPSLDVRYTYAGNSSISQSVFGGGIRVACNVGRLHPYADFMVGSGTIHFKQVLATSTYKHDDSTVFMYGAGVDFDLTRSFAIRADVQRQDWQIDQSSRPFHPVHASLGIRYQFHFRNKYGPE